MGLGSQCWPCIRVPLKPTPVPMRLLRWSKKILKFARFPAIEFKYSDSVLKYLNATSIWIGWLILQIVTTLTSAYSTFHVLVDRCFIRKIKVKTSINKITLRNWKLKHELRLKVNLPLFSSWFHLALNWCFKLSSKQCFYLWSFGWPFFMIDGRTSEIF